MVYSKYYCLNRYRKYSNNIDTCQEVNLEIYFFNTINAKSFTICSFYTIIITS